MCGIVGFTGRPDPEFLRSMCARLAHRGPDDEGYVELPGVSLGMRRLAIVDVQAGRQPVANEDGSVWVVFNGEIYNHLDLRAELLAAGHSFRTVRSDTEVIVHLYEEHGPDFLLRLNGMFGLALWDARLGRLMLARDRLGKKPLYHARAGDGLCFASEIKALLALPGFQKRLDAATLHDFLGMKSSRAPATIWEGVRQLPPGTMLLCEGGAVSTRRYWRPDFTPLQGVGEEEAAAEVGLLLRDSVRLRMDCDVPYGAFLSGGIDSSAVAALTVTMAKHALNTFCLGYADTAGAQFASKAQDLEYARRMSRRLGTRHHERIITAGEFRDEMPQVAQALDEPFSGTVSAFFLAALIRRHVKVALSGDGADELFGSYLSHRLSGPVQMLRGFMREGVRCREDLDPGQLRSLAPFDSPEQYGFLKRIASREGDAWREGLAVFTAEERAELLAPDVLARAARAERATGWAADFSAGGGDELNRTLELDQNGLLHDQVLYYVDRLSMAHSIEVRCPFLDHRLVEYVNRLPSVMKISGGVNKRILKAAVADLLPTDVLERPKEGFVQPVYTWMRGELGPWVHELLRSLPGDLIRPGPVGRLWERFSGGERGLEAKLWNLACLGLWLDGAGRGCSW